MLNSRIKILVVGVSMTIISSISIQAASSLGVSSHLLSSAEKSAYSTSDATFIQDSNLSASAVKPDQKLTSSDSWTNNVPPNTDSKSTDTASKNTASKPVQAVAPSTAAKPVKSTAKPTSKPNSGVSQKSKGVIPFTLSDVDLLARLIEAEAQGVSYNAKVAVGGVVINRVQSSSFPNNIHDVIYQKINGYYQFTPVLNGWINKPASQESINAANAALHGSDPSKGALFYFDESITNTWLWSKKIAVRIDSLVFAF